MFLEKRLKPKESWVFIKTQFSSPDVHIRVIGLLKYLKKKYISNLEVRDEGEYWEKADFKILKEKMDFINSKINYLSSELSSDRLGDIKGLSAEEIAARIERLLKKQ